MGRRITQNDIACYLKKLFRDLLLATTTNAESGFAASGIYPDNPNIFTNEDFLSAEINNKAFDAERSNNYNRVLESPSLLENPPEIVVQTSFRPLSAATDSSGTFVAVSAPDGLLPRKDHNISTPMSSSDMSAISLPGQDCNILAPVSSPGTSREAAPAPAIPLAGLHCNISVPISSLGTSRFTASAPASLPSKQGGNIISVAKRTPGSPLRSLDICISVPTAWGTTDIAVLTSASQLPCLDREIP
ncbi:hypothetical protein O0L34_g9417 [Tuta absoluta]|nr:hypothetical protein O0L34_g9417 [Tuta absoluta]